MLTCRDGTIAAVQAATGGVLLVSDSLKRGMLPLDCLIVRPQSPSTVCAAAWCDQLIVFSIPKKEMAGRVIASQQSSQHTAAVVRIPAFLHSHDCTCTYIDGTSTRTCTRAHMHAGAYAQLQAHS